MSHSIARGLREAVDNALRILGGGAVAALLYLGFVSVGPGIDGWMAPVIADYRLENVRRLSDGGFSFRPSFTKKRDCTYFGVTWFAKDEAGNLTRIQLGRQMQPGPPLTGPTGQRIGDRVTLYPPAGSLSIFGLNHHECGFPWQTRTQVGPFDIINGKPIPAVTDGGNE